MTKSNDRMSEFVKGHALMPYNKEGIDAFVFNSLYNDFLRQKQSLPTNLVV